MERVTANSRFWESARASTQRGRFWLQLRRLLPEVKASRRYPLEAATHLRRLASAVSDPGSVAPPTMKFFVGSSDADPFIMRPNGAPTTRTTLSTAGCAISGKNVANRNSSLGSPLDHVHWSVLQHCCNPLRHKPYVLTNADRQVTTSSSRGIKTGANAAGCAREARLALDLPDAQVQPAEVGAEEDARHRLDDTAQHQATQQAEDHVDAYQVLRSRRRLGQRTSFCRVFKTNIRASCTSKAGR